MMSDNNEACQHVDKKVNCSDSNFFIDYLSIPIRRWKVVISLTISCVVLSIIIALLSPNRYSSTARIIPPSQDNNMMVLAGALTGNLPGFTGDLLNQGSNVDLYVGILNSEVVKDLIIDKFKLMKVYDQKYRIDTYKELNDRVDIVAGKKDGILSITVEDNDPKRAAEIANAFVETLGKITVDLAITSGSNSRYFLQRQIINTRKALANAEDNIKAFQIKHKLLNLPEQAKIGIEGVAQLRAQLAAQELQLSMLRQQFTDSSQEVKTIRVTIAKLRSQIASLEGGGSEGAIPNISGVPGVAKEYVQLTREQKLQEAMLELLTKQYELTKLANSKDVPELQVLQPAKAPDKPLKPKKVLIIFVGVIIGVFWGIFMAFLQEYADGKGVSRSLRLKLIARD